MIEPVHLVVTGGDAPRGDLVDIDQGAQDPADQRRRQAGHLRELAVPPGGRIRGQLAGLLGDRCRVIAHPLQFVGHVIERQQEAQVAGDRLLGGDDGGNQRGQVELGLVDPPVVLDDLEGGRGVVVDERLQGGQDLVLDEHPHPQDGIFDLALTPIERWAEGRSDLVEDRADLVKVRPDVVEDRADLVEGDVGGR